MVMDFSKLGGGGIRCLHDREQKDCTQCTAGLDAGGIREMSYILKP